MHTPSLRKISHTRWKYSVGSASTKSDVNLKRRQGPTARKEEERATDHGRQTRMGVMPMSTNSFFVTEESTDSMTFANSDASMSSCIELEEKYGRRCVSINEMKIQNASSSGDCSSSCPAMNAKPAKDQSSITPKKQRATHPWNTGYPAPWSGTTARARPAGHPAGRAASRQ